MSKQPEPPRSSPQILEHDLRTRSWARRMSMFSFGIVFLLIVLYAIGMFGHEKLRYNSNALIELVVYLLAGSLAGLVLSRYLEKPKRSERPTNWFRQIFENDKRILSCGRIMSMIGFVIAFLLIVLYVLWIWSFLEFPNHDGRIIELVQYLIAVSLVTLIVTKYMERPRHTDRTTRCKNRDYGGLRS